MSFSRILRYSWRSRCFGGGVVAFFLGGFMAAASATPPSAEDLRMFESEVRPVLVERCLRCHGPETQKAGLRLDSLVGLLRGGESGPAIDLANAEESHLVAAIRHDSWQMPPDGKLPETQIEAIVRWVRRGAAWTGSKSAADMLADGLPEPADESLAPSSAPRKRAKKAGITAADREYWAFRRVTRPPLPSVDAAAASPSDALRLRIRNGIDHFIEAKLVDAGLHALPEADRRTLIRRLSFGLIGLPPEPADVESFVADPSADAYERLVERLLADRRHGERMARHWLDVARFAESDGFRQDAFRPTAWRYRDYVVRAFNIDMPYDRFIREQLAGDELYPEDPVAVTATGFLRQTPYEYNIADIERSWTDAINEVTDVTGDVFLAMGVGCARCHDHKFDPILQRDYYQLQSFFAAIRWRDDVPLVSASDIATRSNAQRDYVARVEELRRRLREIEESAGTEKAWAGKLPANRFPPEIQAMVLKPPSARTPREEQLAAFAARQLTFTPAGLPEEQRARYETLSRELADFERTHQADKPDTAPTTLTIGDVGAVAPPTFIPGTLGPDVVEPRVPTVLGGDLPTITTPPDRSSTGRRSALARWIASPDNPLTARVLVNRLWQWHFGRGLAPNASDFGQLGGMPSHPELLDWLACELVDSGWSIRHVNRLIVTSAAFRRGAHPDARHSVNAASDPHNTLFWRFDCRRLDAEQVRDAALAVSGDLDPSAGGPSVPPSKPRRGIYTTVLRNTRDALCDAFDSPDGYTSCAQRNTTTTPMQALFLINGDWMLARARSLALSLDRAGLTDDRELAAAAIRRITGREPTSSRLDEATRFLTEQRGRLDDGSSTLSMVVAQRMPQREGRAAVVDPAMPAAVMTVPGSKPESPAKPGDTAVTPAGPFPTGDFTIEAHVMLHSLFADATVRTIASQWTGSPKTPGWSFGVTSEKSKYRPRNLIVQLAGGGSEGTDGYVVVPSDVHLDLQRPYYVAASVKVSDPTDRHVTFYVKDLSDNDAPLVVKRVEHPFGGVHASSCAFAIGGRDVAADASADGGRSVWDGLIDDVRLSAAALSRGDLLWERGAGARVVGFWTFEETPGFAEDASGQGRALARGGTSLPPVRDLHRYEAIVDLCHVLFNSSEFLYVE